MERKKLKVINIICLVIHSVMIFSVFIEPFLLFYLGYNFPSIVFAPLGSLGVIVSELLAPIFAFIILNLIVLSVVNLIYDKKNEKISLTTTIISIVLHIPFVILLVSGLFITSTLVIAGFVLQIIRANLIDKNNKALKLKNLENH